MQISGRLKKQCGNLDTSKGQIGNMEIIAVLFMLVAGIVEIIDSIIKDK